MGSYFKNYLKGLMFFLNHLLELVKWVQHQKQCYSHAEWIMLENNIV